MVKSGRTPARSWAPPRRDAEAGDDLVEDEQRAVGVGLLAQQLEEAGLRGDDAHVGREWLGDDRGELVLGRAPRARASGSFQGTMTRGPGRGLGHARRGGDGLRGQARARLGQQPVDVAVVGAGELQDLVAAGSRAGEPQRAHRRLGARGGHAQHLHRGHARGDLLGERDLAPGRRAEARAALGRRDDGLEDLRMGVAVDERPPRAYPVDVAVAVDVDDLRALPRSMNSGSRPIARMARTGELTPPGRYSSARR